MKQKIQITGFFSLFFLLVFSCARATDHSKIVQGLDAIWSRGEIDLVDRYFESDYILHSPGQKDLHGRAAVREWVVNGRRAFPDIQLKVEDVAREGDKLVVRYSWHGTNTGPIRTSTGEIPPTGKRAAKSGVSFFYPRNGKIAEEYNFAISVDPGQ